MAAIVTYPFKVEMFVLQLLPPLPSFPIAFHQAAHARRVVLLLQDAAPALWLASCLMAVFISWLHPEGKAG